MKQYLVISFLLLSTLLVKAQPDQKCKIALVAEIKDSLYRFTSDQCFLLLDYKSGKFHLEVPVNSFYSERDSITHFLYTRTSSLIYDGNTGVDLFNLLNDQKNSGEYFPMNGSLNLNGITKGIVSQYALVKLNNSPANTDQYMRITFLMDINPGEFGINKYVPLLTKPLRIEIIEQRLNVQQ
jgi:hypothetical protein